MDSDQYSLKELAELTGIQARTIRSYIAKGLLQGPLSRGRNARYSRHHLDRLREIQVLKARGMSLEEIRRGRLHARWSPRPEEDRSEFPHANPAPAWPTRLRRDTEGIEETGQDAPLPRLLRILQGAVSTRAAHRGSRAELWTQVEVTPEIQLQVRGEMSERETDLLRRIADHMRDILLGEDEAPF